MPEMATKGKERSATTKEDEGSNVGPPPLGVRYYRQMKPKRVSTVEVFWKKTKKPRSGEVTVRLLGAGAQILPVEQTMDAAKPNDKALFYVTPLAKGWLRHLKLEILSQGRKVQEIPMAAKVVSQRLTWFLLFCTFFVPWFITEHIKYSRIDSREYNAVGFDTAPPIAVTVNKHLADNVPVLPGFLKKTAVETGLVESRNLASKVYQQFVQITRIEPIAFYAGVVFMFLSIISAFVHKQKRLQTLGKPIPAITTTTC